MSDDTRKAAEAMEAMADRIVGHLFVNGFGECATRLVMVREEPLTPSRDLGGWCPSAVRDKVLNELRAAASPTDAPQQQDTADQPADEGMSEEPPCMYTARALLAQVKSLRAALQAERERADGLGRELDKEDRAHQITVGERDEREAMLDKLSEAVSAHFRVTLGEHSNANCPWRNALAVLNGEYITDSDDDRRIKDERERGSKLAEAMREVNQNASDEGPSDDDVALAQIGRISRAALDAYNAARGKS